MLNGPGNVSGGIIRSFIGSKSTRAAALAAATLKRISSRCRPSRNNFISKHQKYKKKCRWSVAKEITEIKAATISKGVGFFRSSNSNGEW